jgi:hypothetical protein
VPALAIRNAAACRTLPPMVWEFVFMMVILKIPIVYLCLVVYWAVRAEPKPPELAPTRVAAGPEPRAPWAPRPRRPGPRRGPERMPARARRAPVPR